MGEVDTITPPLSMSQGDCTLISDSAALAEWCWQAAREQVLALDTEFYRDTVYWPQLCLIQACHPSGAAIIDPLAQGLDLAPFEALLANEKILKIFHACRQDLEIFTIRTGQPPAPVFDTQIAAQALGFPSNTGYGTLAAALTETRISKTMRMSDWRKRPLSQEQLDYALLDVVPLLAMWQAIDEKLTQNGRHHWVAPEMEKLSDAQLYQTQPEAICRRLNFNARGEEEWLSMAALAFWREGEAQQRDCPRNRILSEDGMRRIARSHIKSAQDLAAQRGLPRQFFRNGADKRLLQALANKERFRDSWQAKRAASRRGSAPREEVQLLQMLLSVCAAGADVAPALLASSNDIEALILDKEEALETMADWRQEIFAKPALALLRGEMAITFRNGQAALVPSP